MVIGIRGSSGVGKTTFATMLSYYLNNPHNPNLFDFLQYKRELENGYVKGKWKVSNFASTLKIAMATMYGIDYKQYEDGEFKDTKIGQTVWYLNIIISQKDGNHILHPFKSYMSEEDAIKAKEELKKSSEAVKFHITSKELTWRDTLNEASHGLHLYLGQNIALQAYQHRFSNSLEHHIMADVRKPREIDLIYQNKGVIIELKRNFVFMCSYKEAKNFFNQKGYFYNVADGRDPIMETEIDILEELEEYNISVGIDCAPKPNIADSWLDGDDRKDFVFHNPAGNPKNYSSYAQLFEEIGQHYNTILTTLITR